MKLLFPLDEKALFDIAVAWVVEQKQPEGVGLLVEKVRVWQRVNEVCGVCVVERRGMESDAGRGLCDLYSWCGSGVRHFMRLLLFIPNCFWMRGNWERNRSWITGHLLLGEIHLHVF